MTCLKGFLLDMRGLYQAHRCSFPIDSLWFVKVESKWTISQSGLNKGFFVKNTQKEIERYRPWV